MECKVSVLVPVYNVKKYLPACLDSLAAQTMADMEIICIDDGSTDGCSEILDDYAGKDARFRIIHKKNSGYGASMNVGMQAAQGEYIGIVESDDFADPDMFRSLYKRAHQYHADVVKSNYWELKDGLNTFVEILYGHAYDRVVCPRREESKFFLETPSIWSCLYRRTFLQECEIRFNETPGASYQDTSFVFLTKAYAERFLFVKEGYLHYRIDNENSSTHSTKKIFSVIDEYDAVQRHLDLHPLKEYRKLCGLSAQLLYQNFRFTEERIPMWMYTTFWAKGYPKLKAAQQNGVFHEDLGDSIEAWMLQRYMSYRNREILREGFLPLWRSAPGAYLFGAGQVAKGILLFLRQHDCKVDGLLVSEQEGNFKQIDGVSVYAIEEMPGNREQDLVIIATTPRKPEIQQEIFFALEQEGFRNVIVLTEELQRALS